MAFGDRMRKTTKTLYDKDQISRLILRAQQVLPLFCVLWLLSACTPLVAQGSEKGSVFTEPKETLIVITPTPGLDSAAVECTPLPEGMTLKVVPISSDQVRIEAQGLQPGENIKVVLENILPDWSGGVNEITFEPSSPVSEDGTFIYERGDLEPLPGTPSYIWEVKIFHVRGVACELVELQTNEGANE
jgi:hypothetical protein